MEAKEGQTWTPESWKALPIKQQPEYEDNEALAKALAKVQKLPPIVHQMEIEKLKTYLAQACEGKMFLLQGGDCAERFDECCQETIEKKFKILLQMSLIIIWESRVPVVRIARMAGQFAKPRTSNWETTPDGQRVASYKGDSINGFDISERKPDPDRLVQAYFHSVATANYLRAMITGGVSDLHSAPEWNLDNVLRPETKENESLRGVYLFSSHEGLILDYEAALTKLVKDSHYNLGAHFLWIGDRTRQIDGAHIEYFRGIANPIGVKVGPSTADEELVRLIQILNPNKASLSRLCREPGKLTLITRYGIDNVEQKLPGHIKAAQSTGIPVLWVSDPCHGNTESTSDGIKFRNIEKVMGEMVKVFRIHTENGSRLGGVHLELTGLNPTNLSTNYQSFCDPRLNYTQSLDMAFCIASEVKNSRTSAKQACHNHSVELFHNRSGPSGAAPPREYFYWVDLRGHLYCIDKDATTLPRQNDPAFLRDGRFLNFFWRQLQLNTPTSPGRARHGAVYPYVSPCGRELNYVRAADRPIAFHSLQTLPSGESVLLYAHDLSVPFDPAAPADRRT
ncbi:Phospho2-dehydro-3-deoxyheptonate aldolase [Acanthamoeba castellanii str. Neff]|uniref:Phospho-2-dehydro-3-deoxyheptonate aldolase n=1 Tax=Acanthamoeba castellanii (strain ATCC 30010 / Neff) TaxID=1257118 RepID=L8HFZ7_ACACF|nr:Phospho2-dehydro-3-deoxyheptonate aldolase [Acanthamoeba castellanii str. Neff]ELR24167.1 Phospho2-dehydro-3-deoxyheptonate aldolase [Acanthamoeba castellanii str. Neff]